MPCNDPLIDAIEILNMETPRSNILSTQPLTVGADKAIVFHGMRFQSEHWTDPGTWFSNAACIGDDSSVNSLAFILSVWEALVLLPLQQGTNAPEYLPILTGNLQQGDLADRVLWKRISHLPMWGLGVTNNFPQLESTIRDTAHTQIEVKAKCRIDDRHGLYYVRNFVHDIFFTTPNLTSCSPQQCPENGQVITMFWDFWAKTYYKTSRR